MKGFMKIGIIAVLVIMGGLTMISCAEGVDPELLGTWSLTQSVEGVSVTSMLTFESDGTGKQTSSYGGMELSYKFTWSTDGSKLTLVITIGNEKQTSTVDYKVKGNKLTITTDGASQVYTKK